MPRIILSLTLIVLVFGALVFGGTTAFFSDTETSAANVFTSGAIDLKIGNASYYNGAFNEGTSWLPKDLAESDTYFFNFADVKPDDYGEDTISLTVDTNDAYMCAQVMLRSNDDNDVTEPESEVDPNGDLSGELAGLINLMWWADDGDNVLESDEEVLSQPGPLGALTIGAPYPLTLADSDDNIWTGEGGPVKGGETYFIGKAWCLGTLAPAPLVQDEKNDVRTPDADNNNDDTAGTPEDGGYRCDGTGLGNESQTDSATLDVQFEAVQARHNERFQCEGPTGGSCEISEVETLIPNSGFENPEVAGVGAWDIFDSPAGAWNVLWRSDIPPTFGPQSRPNPAHLEIHEGVLGAAYEGDQYAELDTDWGGPSDGGNGEPASVVLYQDVPTTPGTKYRVKFVFAPRPQTSAAENRLEVKFDGNVVYDSGLVADPNSGIEWQQISVDVTASSSVSRLEFTDRGTANSLGTFVDDIRLYGEVCE